MSQPHILVTGGAGYVGSVLVHRLLAQTEFKVRVLDSLKYGGGSLLPIWGSGRLQLVRGDIRDIDTVQNSLQDIDYVVHLAALVGEPICKKYPEEAKTTNLDGTMLLADASEHAGVKLFILASTCSNYGMRNSDHPVDEDGTLEPISLYAETKVQAENHLRDNSKLRSVVLRFATVFGASPRMRFDLLVHEFIREAYLNHRITVYGAESWRPIIHVQDVATAVISAIDMAEVLAPVYNVGGDSQNYRKREIADIVSKFFPYATSQVLSSVADSRSYRVNFQRIREDIGFEPRLSVEDGVAEISDALRMGIFEDGILQEGNAL